MIKHILRILVSGVFVVYIVLNVDWPIIYETFQKIDIPYYLLSTGLAIFASLFLAIKYHLFIKNTPLALPISKLIKINFISRFYALFLPSALGPEAVRWYKITKNKQGRSFFLACTMAERLIFLLILLLFGSLPLFFYPENTKIITLRHQIFPLLITAFILIGLGLIYFIFPSIQNFIKKIIIKAPLIRKIQKLNQFIRNFSIKQPLFPLLAPLVCLSLLWQLVFLLRLFFLFLSLDLPLTFMDVAWMASLVMLLQALPISFAGIGVREGTYAYLLTLFNLPSEKGVLIGILFFTQMIVLAAIGGIFNLFEK